MSGNRRLLMTKAKRSFPIPPYTAEELIAGMSPNNINPINKSFYDHSGRNGGNGNWFGDCIMGTYNSGTDYRPILIRESGIFVGRATLTSSNSFARPTAPGFDGFSFYAGSNYGSPPMFIQYTENFESLNITFLSSNTTGNYLFCKNFDNRIVVFSGGMYFSHENPVQRLVPVYYQATNQYSRPVPKAFKLSDGNLIIMYETESITGTGQSTNYPTFFNLYLNEYMPIFTDANRNICEVYSKNNEGYIIAKTKDFRIYKYNKNTNQFDFERIAAFDGTDVRVRWFENKLYFISYNYSSNKNMCLYDENFNLIDTLVYSKGVADIFFSSFIKCNGETLDYTPQLVVNNKLVAPKEILGAVSGNALGQIFISNNQLYIARGNYSGTGDIRKTPFGSKYIDTRNLHGIADGGYTTILNI